MIERTDRHIRALRSRARCAMVNDNCAAARTLVMGTGATPSGTVAQATQTIAAVNCNGFTGNANDDVCGILLSSWPRLRAPRS